MTEDIKKACQMTSEGGVILYPTDTIQRIGCDVTSEDTAHRMYEIKQRVDSKAMLALVDSSVKVEFYVQDVPSIAWDSMEVAGKPLTIVYSGVRNLAPNLLAEDGSADIRVMNEVLPRRLCQQLYRAIASTFANISRQPGTANFNEASEGIKPPVDYTVNFWQDDMSRPKPLSVIKLDKDGVAKVIRE